MTDEKSPPPPKPPRPGPARAEDVAKAFMDALAMPQDEFDAKLRAFEEERDREAQENLKALRLKRQKAR